MTTTITVENCASCPFVMCSPNDDEPWLCDALQADGEPRAIPEQRVFQSDGDYWPDPPEWCPLRSDDRLVQLRVK